MQSTIRLASEQVAVDYPLSVQARAQWRRQQEQVWSAVIELEDVPAGHIIVPSFAMLPLGTREYAFRFALQGTTSSTLPPVPAQAAQRLVDGAPAAGRNTAVSTHIDCWHTEHDLRGASLQVLVASPVMPAEYLLTLTVRPLQLDAPRCPLTSIQTRAPASLSQMRAAKKIRQRICSPTALAMVLNRPDRACDWQATIDGCFDTATRAYGVWPLAIRWASLQGVIGAVEAFSDWDSALTCIEADAPLVCSIRFDRGGLRGAPLDRTGGHLVVLYGIDGNEVLVKDPAASTHEAVDRRYDAAQFSAAWLARRGAAYVLSPRQRNAAMAGNS